MQAVLMVMRLPLEPCRRLRLPCFGPNQFADKCGARHRRPAHRTAHDGISPGPVRPRAPGRLLIE